MELDRNVSDYMQRKNVLATKVAGIFSAEMLMIAVFFLGRLLTETSKGSGISHSDMNTVFKGMLVILSLVIALCGTIVMTRNRHFYGSLPDGIGLRQSQEVIEYAYNIARPALIFKMTMAGIALAAGIFISLTSCIITKDFTYGIYIPKFIFFITLAVFLFMFIPSAGRMMSYKEMLSRYTLLSYGSSDDKKSRASESFFINGITLFIIMPIAVCVYLWWRYFGTNTTIAWITFCVAGIIYGAVILLSDYAGRCKDENSPGRNPKDN